MERGQEKERGERVAEAKQSRTVGLNAERRLQLWLGDDWETCSGPQGEHHSVTGTTLQGVWRSGPAGLDRLSRGSRTTEAEGRQKERRRRCAFGKE